MFRKRLPINRALLVCHVFSGRRGRHPAHAYRWCPNDDANCPDAEYAGNRAYDGTGSPDSGDPMSQWDGATSPNGAGDAARSRGDGDEANQRAANRPGSLRRNRSCRYHRSGLQHLFDTHTQVQGLPKGKTARNFS